MAVQDRKRRVDVDSMPEDQVDMLADKIGEKVRKICDDAVEEANKILKIYGIRVKMQFCLEEDKQTDSN